nr:NAD-dependent deacylase [Pseudomonas sp. FFPRI_1]
MEFDPQRLAQARHLLVFTGAGVSAESGIPTFRDALSGLWEHFDPARLATPQAFREDPALVWGWYEWRRLKVLEAQPNPAHLAIAELARRVPRLTLVTQNVDDLHERAGSSEVLHLHGSLHTPKCFACNRPFNGQLPVPELPEQGASLEPPRCSGCNGKIRPGVVWFGEALPQQALKDAFKAADECDLLLSVGTSGLVQPAAQIPLRALRQGACVLHINPQPQACSAPEEYSLTGKAGELLPELVRRAFA